MHTKFVFGLAGALGTTLIQTGARAAEAPAAPAAVSAASRNACEALRNFHQVDITIMDAGVIAAGQVHPQDSLPAAQRPQKAYCRVEAHIEGNIGFLAWLPLREDWSGRVLGVGNGGDAGSFVIGGIARAVREGMVGTTTDAGHRGDSDPLWAMSRKKMEDYTHRAQHLTAVLGRELTAAYYGAEPKKSYFSGCSGGGRQALTEMQAFPEDYDGIVAGAPAAQQDVQMARKQWVVRLAEDEPQAALSEAKWDMVVAETIKQCDAIDGVTDGLLENPMACKLDVTKLACKPGQTGDTCLTPPQVGMVNKFYGPFKDENGVERGPRPAPGIRPITEAPITGVHSYGHAVHQEPNWTRKDMVIGKDIDALNRILPLMGPNNPDLTKSVKRGAKTIIYQGWGDSLDMVTYNIQNYDRIVAYPTNGGLKKVQETVRLFLAPNIGHCGGPNAPSWQNPGQAGYNPDGDPLALVIRWVEQGKAPEKLLASQVKDGKVARTRPLCVYPQTSHYTGKGSTDEAENFVCR